LTDGKMLDAEIKGLSSLLFSLSHEDIHFSSFALSQSESESDIRWIKLMACASRLAY